jgi:N-acetylglucosaminyl-diphospho-decaprenol L-rhamnosyltransferase
MTQNISVIILNYFSFGYTTKCIKSVQQSLMLDIYLVDNSADFNEKRKIMDAFQKEKTIHMYFPDENLGFAAGVNRGLKEAIKDGFNRFFLLNNDTILLDGLKEKLEKAFFKYPGALIAPTIKWGNSLNRGYYYHKYFGFIAKEKFMRSNSWIYYLSGCALAFDSEFLNKVGFFSEKFFMYGEDIELAYRAQIKNVPLILIPDELVIHEGSHSARMASFFYEYHITRCHYLLCSLLFRHLPNQIIAFLAKALTLTLRAFIRSLRYQSWSPLKALMLATLPLKVRPIRSDEDQNN